MIDIHSHIIPAIDDGSTDLDITLEMLKKAEQEGTTTIIATPHYIGGVWETNYNEVKEKVKKLNDLAKSEGLTLHIKYGQEVYYHNEIIESFESGAIGTLAHSKYMLIEFPMQRIPKNAIEKLYELQIKGIVPVIAHPERYDEFKEDPTRINKYIDEGYLFQLNGGSVLGTFGKDVKKTAEIFLRNNIYSFIGSDAHSNGRRHTGLREASDICNSMVDNCGEIFLRNSEKLLNDEEIKFNGKKIEPKKGFLSFLFRK